MVSDRNRQIIERRRSGESFSAIGSALGISRERVREIVEREERRDQRARELEEAARHPQQSNPLQLSAATAQHAGEAVRNTQLYARRRRRSQVFSCDVFNDPQFWIAGLERA